jgi:methylmalonyl-CoA mutase, N-terminal domain
VRRGHRLARRYGDPLRRHQPRKRHHIDDHQFTGQRALGHVLVVAEKQGADWKKISGTIQNDILKEYIAQKEYIYPPAPSMRLVIDTFEFGSKFTPRFNTISISGYHIREAGSTALQELAFTIYDGVEYVEWARRRGLDVDDFGPRLSFFFNAHNDFFEEIAKYRAARKIWYRLMKDRFGAKNDRTRLMRFHTQTAGVSLPAQQPMNNIARVALQALAAVLGGTQSLHTDAYDEALALPTEEAARIALRTQQIIAFESGVAQTVDPLGGSYFVEKQTLDMEKAPSITSRSSIRWAAWSKPSNADTRRKKLPRPVTSTSARLKPMKRSRSA